MKIFAFIQCKILEPHQRACAIIGEEIMLFPGGVVGEGALWQREMLVSPAVATPPPFKLFLFSCTGS